MGCQVPSNNGKRDFFNYLAPVCCILQYVSTLLQHVLDLNDLNPRVLSSLCFEHLFFNWYRQDFLTLRKDSDGASKSLFLSLFLVMVQPVMLYKHLPIMLMRNLPFALNTVVFLVCRCLMEQQ